VQILICPFSRNKVRIPATILEEKMMGFFDNIKKAFMNDKKEESMNVTDNNASSGAEQERLTEVYQASLESQRMEKDHFFKHSPYSPIEDRANFGGLNYYLPDPAYRYVLPLQKADQPELLTFQTNTGDEQTYHRLGTVEFEVEGETACLAVYQSTEHDDLFLPFRDATSGQETYGGGRYLEPQDLGDGRLLVDFNLAYNPFCAYSVHYSCPLPPFENHLKTVAVRAGEKSFKRESTSGRSDYSPQPSR
jgi:uncharacterized protein (DUF1684 family)